MARKRRFRFGLPIVFAGRPSVGGVGLGCQPVPVEAEAFRIRKMARWCWSSKAPWLAIHLHALTA